MKGYNMTKVITMMPVRLAATRLPNKPLLNINGKTLIQRVYENVEGFHLTRKVGTYEPYRK